MIFTGTGTQKVEDILKNIFPKSRILRMDTDTIKNKGSLDNIFTQFKQKKADILLGTQMIA